jgi:uncharacterized membrane protein
MDVGSAANTLLIISFGIAGVGFVAGTLVAPFAIYRATKLHQQKLLVVMGALYGVALVGVVMCVVSWILIIQFDSSNW